MTQADKILANAVAEGALPGVVAGVTDARGTLHLAAHGPAMRTDTLFWIASMTKAMTSVAAMQAVERGDLDLDAPAGALLPVIAAPQVLEGFDETGAPLLRPAAHKITARHLLTHTAGYGYDTWNPDISRYNALTGLSRRLTSDDELARTPLLFDPGTRWNYSIATDILGRVLEQATSRRLSALLAEGIFARLGMADTGFRLSDAQKPRVAPIHRRAASGFTTHGPAAVGAGQGYAGGGGGLVSSVPDYLAFLRALLAGKLISAESWAEMARNQIGDLPAGILRTAQPELSFDADFFPGQRAGWGLGFLLNPAGTRLAWAGLGNTYFWIDLARGIAGVFATQMLPFADPRVVATLVAYEEEVSK